LHVPRIVYLVRAAGARRLCRRRALGRPAQRHAPLRLPDHRHHLDCAGLLRLSPHSPRPRGCRNSRIKKGFTRTPLQEIVVKSRFSPLCPLAWEGGGGRGVVGAQRAAPTLKSLRSIAPRAVIEHLLAIFLGWLRHKLQKKERNHNPKDKTADVSEES